MASVPDAAALPAAPPHILDDLYALLLTRRGADPGVSYAARLMHGGTDAILKKLGEEATEVILAAKDLDAGLPDAAGHTVRELADLCYHALVLMAHHDIPPARVRAELARRQGTGGLAEKAARPHQESSTGAAIGGTA